MTRYKYKLSGETHVYAGVTYYRIEALRDFGSGPRAVRKGDKGGLISPDSTISHSGNCWVFDNAMLNSSKLFGNATIHNNAYVCKSVLRGDVQVNDRARIIESSIKQMATIRHFATVSQSLVEGAAIVDGNAMIYKSTLRGSAHVDGPVHIEYGFLTKATDVFFAGPVGSEDGTLTVFLSKKGRKLHRHVTRGCFEGPLSKFESMVNKAYKADHQFGIEYRSLLIVAKLRVKIDEGNVA